MGISVQILTIEGSLDWFDHGYALSHGQYDLLCSLVILHILVEVVHFATFDNVDFVYDIAGGVNEGYLGDASPEPLEASNPRVHKLEN